MTRPTVYLETSVISYLAARPSRDMVTATRQDITREWWDTAAHSYELYVRSLFSMRRAKAMEPARRGAWLSSANYLSLICPAKRPVLKKL